MENWPKTREELQEEAQPLTEQQWQVVAYNHRQRRRLRAGERSTREANGGGYNVNTDNVLGGRYGSAPLPAASSVNVRTFFRVVIGGTISAPNAPELSGQSASSGDDIVATTSGYILREAGP